MGGRRRSHSSGGGGSWPAEGLDSLGVGLICMIVASFVLCFNCFYYGCCDALHNSDFGSSVSPGSVDNSAMYNAEE